MAPARRRGANKAKANGHLSLGDLVLAKVKGFPAWPAKISRPEDWDKPPDPKKYFVQFFGTKEIAFVAPPDIQAFTNEAKNKLSARCHGKTRYFSLAVKEICAAFDELQKQKASGLRDNTDNSRIDSEAPSADGVLGHLKDATDAVGSIDKKDNTCVEDVGSNLGRCTQRCEESDSQDEEPSVSSCPNDSSSSVLSPVIKSKSSIRAELNKNCSKSNLKDPSCLKVEVSDCKDACNVNDFKQDDNAETVFTNGNRPRKLGTGSRRRNKAEDERNRIVGSNRTFLKDENSEGCADLSGSGETLKGGSKEKNAFAVKLDLPGALKSDSDVNSVNKDKNLLKFKTSCKVKNELQEIFIDSEVAHGKNSFKQKKTQVQAKHNLGTDETLLATKKLKSMHTKDDMTLGSLPKIAKSALPSSIVVEDKAFRKIELNRSTSCLKTEKSLPSRGKTGVIALDDAVHEVLPGTKYRQVQQAMPDSASLASDENTERSSLRLKGVGDPNNLMIKQVQRQRRAICLFDYDDDEPKTPVHGAGKNIKSPSFVSEVMKNGDAYSENSDVAHLANRKSSGHEDCHLKKPSSELHNDTVSTGQPQKEKAGEVIPVHVPHCPDKLDSKQFPSRVEKLSSGSTVKSPQLIAATKSNTERYKSSKPLLKVSSNAAQKKADHGSSACLNSTSSSQNQVATHKKKLASSVETSKTTPKALPQAVEVPAVTEDIKEPDAFHVDRLEVGMEENSSLYTESRIPETAKTMKHLIAAAQAKRRQTHSQCLPVIHNVQGGTPSPSTTQPFLSVSSMQTDLQGVYEHPKLASPSTNGHHSASRNQLDAEEIEERRVGSVQKAVGGSVSGGTEVAVARDAFEGMIETLSRTKESIGRATRLAIDCAKYGIANEVVELLIRKLENETSFHRKVDLFFLVDSITQCSHNQKGIAGAFYVPTVQDALPRLLGAAAPPGASARENRRQCLKVLRLWLERKIFPESVLRRYMNDVGVSNDDMTVSFSLRHPSRVERAVDDPIREMEGMLVDEYGSNATFQLPGFLSSHVFEEDEDDEDDVFPSKASPADPTRTLVESETSTVTLNDKRHFILEDVDGELEMEDVSGHLKDEKPVLLNSSAEMDLQLQGLERNLNPSLNISTEMPGILEGSPPLPLESPPLPPPLPPSPPPPPPSLSLSPPPPPPPAVLQAAPPPLPPSGPPLSLIPQSSGLAQPSLLSQPLMPPQSSHHSSPQLGNKQRLPHDYSGTTGGNQIVQMAGNSFPGGHNSSVVKNEIFPQPSACFPQTVGCSSQEPSGFNPSRQLEYGQNEMYLNGQVPQSNQQFQQGNLPFVQRHMHPALPQNLSNQYSYPKPTVQQHLLHSFHPPFSLPSLQDGQRQFFADEQWRIPSSEFKTNNQHGVWRGINPSCPGPPLGQEGYFRPPLERPPVSNVGFQHANPSSLTGAPLLSGHGAPQMMPCRPDTSALNCWRPT